MNSLSIKASKKVKQLLSVALSLTTTLVLSGFAALVPVVSVNAALVEGSLIKTADAPEVYIINDKAHGSYLGWKRHIFNPEVFNMYGHFSWSDIQIVSQAVVDSYETSDLYKADVDPRVYLLEEMGSSAVKHHIANIETFNAKGYSWDQVFTVNEKEVNYYATGSPITMDDNSGNSNNNEGNTAGNVTVSLASSSPASTSLIEGQAVADMAHFTLTNTSSTDAKVTKVTLNRIGVSSDTTLSNVYLFDGVTRLTDAATVSSGVITFVNTAGIVTIPANSSKTIAVKSDIAGSTTGQIVGVALSSVESNVAVSGSFPVSGATHTIATATLANVDFSTTTTPSANSSLDPQDDYTMWENSITVGTRSAYLHALSLRMIGSAQNADLANFELFVDGVKVGNTVPSLDSNGYAVFDLSSSPVELKTGNRTLKMVGDVVGGSSRNFKFSLRQAADISVTDKDYGSNILVRGSSSSTTGTFVAHETGQQDIASGDLTITKKSDSPSDNVVLDATGVTLATFELKASGEPMKVENLYASVKVNTANNTSITLRNGALYADGVQVGSTASLESASSGTYYSFGSSLIVNPGTPVTLEVRADIFDDDGTNDISADDTLQVELLTGSSNVQQMTSLGYTNSPSASGSTVTVVSGTMSLAKYTAYADQTAVVPQTTYKLGEFRLTSDETEDVTLNTITLALKNGGTGLSATSTDITNLYVVYGPNTTSVKSSGSNSQSWSVSKVLPKNTTWDVVVYADFSSDITSGESVIAELTFAGTTVSSAQSVTAGATTGQTITAGTGTFTAAVDASKPATALSVAGQTIKVGSFKFTSTNENYTIDQLGVSVASGSEAVIQNVIFKDTSGNTIATQPFNGRYATTSTGLNFTVPANMDKVVDVYMALGNVGVGAATTSLDVKATLNSYKVKSSTGSTTTAYPAIAGNSQYIVKTMPTVDMVAVSGNLSAGSGKELTKVKISSDSAGTIGWKKLVFTVTKTSGVTIGATSTLQLVDSSNTVISGTFATSTASVVSGLDALGSATSGTISFVADSEQQISGSETYTLKGTVGGISSGYNYLSVSVAAPSTSMATPDTYSNIAGADGLQTPSLVWTDRSASAHSESTADWLNDYKVENLPTNSTTLDVTI